MTEVNSEKRQEVEFEKLSPLAKLAQLLSEAGAVPVIRPFLVEDANGNKTHYRAEDANEFFEALEAKISQLEQQAEEARVNYANNYAASENRAHKAEEGKNTAYSERDRLVCAISKIFPSWLERHPLSDTTWEDDWRWIVFVQFPTGQASWHIHDSEEIWFDHLERRDGNSWDGHSTAEKYARIERFERIGELQARQESAAEGGR